MTQAWEEYRRADPRIPAEYYRDSFYGHFSWPRQYGKSAYQKALIEEDQQRQQQDLEAITRRWIEQH